MPFRKISGINDLSSTAYISYCNAVGLKVLLASMLGQSPDEFIDNDTALRSFSDNILDLIFIDICGGDYLAEGVGLCHALRDSNFRGIVVLVADDLSAFANTSMITSEGFDSCLIVNDSVERIRDTLEWSILNRKRRNKHIIQFDENSDSFYTVDREGHIYDINRRAVDGIGFSPKEIVKLGVNIRKIDSLGCFEGIVRPLIEEANIGKSFTETVNEGELIFQVVTRIHNEPTLGLIATVVKTNITKSVYSHTMDILVNSVTLLSERDHYTAGHSSRVFYYCMKIVEKLGLDRDLDLVKPLYFASLLHDIGKIGIKDNILLKPGKLNDFEFNELATHPVKGYNMLRPYSFLSDALDLVRSHHERPDGMGYPDKLKGKSINPGALVIGVADCFDAMTTNRPYRNSLPYERAIEEIKDNLGTQFDREFGGAFLDLATPSLIDEVAEASRKPLGEISKELVASILGH